MPCKMLTVFIVAVVLGLSAPGVLAKESSQCRYCKSHSYGRNCPYSPNKTHEHITSARACKWCGNATYGRSCPYAPDKTHQHGIDGKHCTWCGKTTTGRNCPYAPDRVHSR